MVPPESRQSLYFSDSPSSLSAVARRRPGSPDIGFLFMCYRFAINLYIDKLFIHFVICLCMFRPDISFLARFRAPLLRTSFFGRASSAFFGRAPRKQARKVSMAMLLASETLHSKCHELKEWELTAHMVPAGSREASA